MLRTRPNDTFGSLSHDFSQEFLSAVTLDGSPLSNERVERISLNGLLTVVSRFGEELEVTRTLFASTRRALFCEEYRLRNVGARTLDLRLSPVREEMLTEASAGMEGSYRLVAATDFSRERSVRLAAGESCVFAASIRGMKHPEVELPLEIERERQARENRILLPGSDERRQRKKGMIRREEERPDTFQGDRRACGNSHRQKLIIDAVSDPDVRPVRLLCFERECSWANYLSTTHLRQILRSLRSAAAAGIKYKKSRAVIGQLGLKRRLPTLPRDNRSTIGVSELNFSVRNGKRWNLTAITT